METPPPKNMPRQGDFSFLPLREIGEFLTLFFKHMTNYSHLWDLLDNFPEEADFTSDLPEEFRNLYTTHLSHYDNQQFALGMRIMRNIRRLGWEAWVRDVRNA